MHRYSLYIIIKCENASIGCGWPCERHHIPGLLCDKAIIKLNNSHEMPLEPLWISQDVLRLAVAIVGKRLPTASPGTNLI